MPTIHQDIARLRDPLSTAFFAADFRRAEWACRTPRPHRAHPPSPPARTCTADTPATQGPPGPIDWTEEDVVRLHWGLLRELRRLQDPDTPLEEKLDTLAWALTDPRLDGQPFSLATCIRVVGTSPLSPTPYFGAISVESIRDWIRACAPSWLRQTLARYPEWVRQLVRSQPDWVCSQLARNPQWINEQVKLRRTTPQPDLFGDPAVPLTA